MVQDGDLEVIDGLLQVALVAVGKVPSQAICLLYPMANVPLVSPPPHPEVFCRADIICSSGVPQAVGP